MDLILYSVDKALRISTKDVSLLKRNTIGTLGMGGKHGPMEGMSIIYTDKNNPTKYILVVTESGKVNKFLTSGFERSQRNKAGSKVIDLGKNDRIYKVFGVTDNDVLSITTTSNNLQIKVKDINLASSISKGEKIINTKSDIILKAEILK